MKETLVILAAGMGSRYGGLKQIDTLGSNGESIIDFTIYDAIQTGFKKLVLIIRKEHEEIFEEHLVKKVRPFIEVEYAYQDINDIPSGVEIPAERVKPWGTTHALLACRNILKEDPFVVCNADDFYGRDSFKKVMEYFHSNAPDNEYCMIGFKVENTLSENGTVTRGVCKKDENGYLSNIKEVMAIKWNDKHDAAIYEDNGNFIEMEKATPVSMNFWGFKPSIIGKLNEIFINEIGEGVKTNPLKYEALLPNHVGQLVKEGQAKVKVLTSDSAWFGVTYKEDKDSVVAKLQGFKDQGVYPFDLWEVK
ncbi:MAG: sugar phosphate nucleotidyltransferase [Erysipelotrichaceae bacterium]|nr:sugar phosphate nucleotidyltransferase [Erysipelotrichaceae bacterium]